MSGPLRLLWLTLAAMPLIAQAAPPDAVQPLRPVADCPRADRITEWHVVDDHTTLLRTGPLNFVVRTAVACPRVGQGGGLNFRQSPGNAAVAPLRICGDIDAQVIRKNDPPCPIASVQAIDKATYDQMAKKTTRHSSGAGPAGKVGR